MNPYQHDQTAVEQIETERTVIIDPATGIPITIGARIERLRLDATGQQKREIVHIVAPSADGQQLLYPYAQKLFSCAICGARPLVRSSRCDACGRHICDACRSIENDVTRCTACGTTPWWQKVFTWLGKL